MYDGLCNRYTVQNDLERIVTLRIGTVFETVVFEFELTAFRRDTTLFKVAVAEARSIDAPQEDQQRNTVEFSALTTHLMWAESVGDNQPELGLRKLRKGKIF